VKQNSINVRKNAVDKAAINARKKKYYRGQGLRKRIRAARKSKKVKKSARNNKESWRKKDKADTVKINMDQVKVFDLGQESHRGLIDNTG
jgi:hypothetical protein